MGNEEEGRRAIVLRDVLDKILQFEKTPCPFERNFTVDLPERPQTPVKKRAWTPPARTVSMNWPPGQPITPPPEFPSRTRFYNPGARRFSDFGVDTSKLGLTPAMSPQQSVAETQEEGEKPGTPSRQVRLEDSLITCKPLMEEPEPLSPPPTAVPASIAQVTEGPSLKASETLKSEPEKTLVQPSKASTTPETRTTQIQVRKREPIWITKKVPSSATRKARRPAVTKAQSTDSVAQSVEQSTEDIRGPQQADSEQSTRRGDSAPAGESAREDSPNETTDDSEAEGGALQGSGQLRVRRTRLAAFASRRAATAPSLRLSTSSVSTVDSVEEQAIKPKAQMHEEPSSPAESIDSFFSMESWHSPLSPAVSPTFSPSETFPYPHENIPLNNGPLSAFITTPTVSGWDRNSVGAVVGSGAQTPDTPFTDVHDEEFGRAADDKSNVTTAEEVEKPVNAVVMSSNAASEDDDGASSADSDSLATSWSSAASRASSRSNTSMRHRAATTSVAISHSNPRALSPLPPAANLLTVDLNNRASTTARAIRRIPSSIFNKTCEILISPPAHLISLMLKVAERITAGEWRGFTFGMGEDGEVLDVRWDWTEDGELDAWGLERDLDFRRGVMRPRASFAASELALPGTTTSKAAAGAGGYQDPWATPPEEPDLDDGEHWSQSWGVD